MKRIGMATVLALAVLLVAALTAGATGETVCPHGADGWSEHQDPPLEEVNGAVEYCGKGGSDNSQGCEGYLTLGSFDKVEQQVGDEDACDLSHWSYRHEVTPTPKPTKPPTSTPSPTVTPTESESSQTPTATVTTDPCEGQCVTPTDTADPCVDGQCVTPTPTRKPPRHPPTGGADLTAMIVGALITLAGAAVGFWGMRGRAAHR
jgi:hypothetical protein